MQESAKWHDRLTLKQVEQVHSADGKKMVKATLTHAKKFGFLTSVTSVIGTIASFQLEQWKIGQAIRACIGFPFKGEDTDEEVVKEYIAMINSKAGEYAKTSADRGKVIHGDVARWERAGGTLPDDPASRKICQKLAKHDEELGVTEVSCETSFGSAELGWCGTPDRRLVTPKGIVYQDFKTTDLRKYKSPYDSWRLQLAAYGQGEAYLLEQVVADRDTGDVVIVEHDQTLGFEAAFAHLFALWCVLKQYWPHKWKGAA